MREIKFRAWDGESKRMSKPFHIDELKFGYIKDIDNCVMDKDLVLMQFTGFKDKNGKEIYFSDIVKFSFNDPFDKSENYKGTAVITETINMGVGLLFDYDARGISFAVIEGGEIEEVWEDKRLWKIEVIGNIYENPKKLNETKKIN